MDTHLPANELRAGILNDYMPRLNIIWEPKPMPLPTNELDREIEFLERSQTYPRDIAVIIPSKEIEDARRRTAQERRATGTQQRSTVRYKSARE